MGTELILDAYFGMALPLALQGTFGYEVLHASAVLVEQRGVIAFSGVSTTGKSTFAQALARRGHALWADDALAFEITAEGVTSTSLPLEPKLRSQSQNFFDRIGLTQPVQQPPEWSRAPLAAVFMLDPRDQRGADGAVDIAKIGAPDSLSELLANGFRFRPLDTARENRVVLNYLELVATVPVFRLTYQRRLDALPSVVDEVEAAALP